MKFRTVTVKELLSDISMGPFGSNIKRDCYVEQGIPYLNGSNLSGFKLKEETFNYVTEAKADSLGRAVAHRGDVIVTHRGTLGQIVYIPESSKYDRYVTGNSQFRLTCNDEILPEYLVYYFHSPVGRHKLLSNASQVGVPALARPTGTFQQLEIELPDIAYQKKVCSILSALVGKVECNERINENLYQQLFALYDYYCDSADDGEIELGALCQFQEGYVNPAQTHPEYFGGDVKWLRAVDINESFIIETSRTLTQTGFQSAKKSAYLFSPNTIAISKSGTIGRLGIVGDYMCGNRAVINIAPKDPLLLPYIYAFLKSHQKQFPDLAVGSVQKNLYVSLLEPLPVRILAPDSLSEFCNAGNAILNAVYNNCQENIRLAQLRDTLLPRLMTGELDVSRLTL